MKKIIQVLILAVSVLLILIACSASSPQDQMTEINELISEGFPISVEQQEQIDTYTATGKSLLEEGKTTEAGEAFASAIKILKLAQDANIFNKAD